MLGQDNKNCIIVIGDIMLDEYVFGTVSRVSPESCCPILRVQHTTIQLGGAANVAYQIHKLGKTAILVGIIGKDKSGEILSEELRHHSIDCQFLFRHDSVTTKKTRYVNDVHQQMYRVDKEEHASLNADELNTITAFIKENSPNIDCIVLSDYNKGVLTNDSCQAIIGAANAASIPTIVDIKVPETDRYKGATVIKGNQKEFSSFFNSSNRNQTTMENDMRALKQKLDAEYMVVTIGKKGIVSIDDKGNYITHRAKQVMVYDVTGAGDIVTAYLGVLFKTMPFERALWFANKAGEIKVTKFGNAHVAFNELYSSANKIKNTSEIAKLTKGQTVVFTNGCFDVLHAGHIDLLQYAKSKGDILVVGINSDDSVRRLKGEKRPVNNLETRVKVLSAISDVDYIVSFEDDTPERIIHEIKPSVLIKGGDYSVDDIVGADYVREYGGIVEAMPFHYNLSTTKILSSL